MSSSYLVPNACYIIGMDNKKPTSCGPNALYLCTRTSRNSSRLHRVVTNFTLHHFSTSPIYHSLRRELRATSRAWRRLFLIWDLVTTARDTGQLSITCIFLLCSVTPLFSISPPPTPTQLYYKPPVADITTGHYCVSVALYMIPNQLLFTILQHTCIDFTATVHRNVAGHFWTSFPLKHTQFNRFRLLQRL